MDGRKIGAVVAVVVALLAVVVLRGGGGDDEVVNPNTLLGVGSCLDLDGGDGDRRPVDCGSAHDGEVFAKYELGDSAWPGPVDVGVLGEQGCIERWDRAVGTNYYTDVRFDFVTFDPDEARWETGDREVVCVLVPADRSTMIGRQTVG